MMSVLERFQEGGIFMWFILAFGLMTAGLVIERGIALYSRVAEIPADFRNQLMKLIAQQNFSAASMLATNTAPRSGIGRIISAGLNVRTNAGGAEELQARMDEKLSSEISSIDRRVGFLAMFGNVATLLGLLGTISGMIHSFAAVASASPADRATMLSKGISEAMNCTAFGLLVAIPALIAYAVYQNRTDRLVSGLTETTTEVFHDLMFLADTTEESVSASTNAAGSASGKASRGSVISQTPSVSM